MCSRKLRDKFKTVSRLLEAEEYEQLLASIKSGCESTVGLAHSACVCCVCVCVLCRREAVKTEDS